MLMMVPRGLSFVDGVWIGSSWNTHNPNAESKTVLMPTDHYDFMGPVNPVGKTIDQINAEIAAYS